MSIIFLKILRAFGVSFRAAFLGIIVLVFWDFAFRGFEAVELVDPSVTVEKKRELKIDFWSQQKRIGCVAELWYIIGVDGGCRYVEKVMKCVDTARHRSK